MHEDSIRLDIAADKPPPIDGIESWKELPPEQNRAIHSQRTCPCRVKVALRVKLKS